MPETDHSLLPRLIDAIVRGRYVLLSAAALLLVLAWAASWEVELRPFRLVRKLEFDQSIESLFAPDNPHLLNYLESKELFGGDEFVFVAWTDPVLFVPDGAALAAEATERIQSLAGELNAVPGVVPESTQHLVEALSPHGLPPLMQRLLPVNRLREQVEGILVGKDGRTTAIVLRLVSEHEAPVPRPRTIREIRGIAERFGREHGFETYVAGEPVQVHDLFRYVEEDGRVLFWWSLGLLGGVIAVLFRSLRWVLLPLVVVVVTIVWTEAVLVLSGLRLSMVSSMLNSLVTIIGIATVMHVTVHFREHRRRLERVAALRRTLLELLPPIVWTCATTAVGFAALMSSQITPVRSFGLMMSLATLLVIAAAVGVLPGGILLGRAGADPRGTPAEGRLVSLLAGVTHWVERRPLQVASLFLAVIVFAGLGFFRLEVETDFSRNFRRDSEIVRALEFMETRLGGAGTWEVNFPAPEQPTKDHLDRVRDLAENLRDGYVRPDAPTGALTKVVALTDGLDLVPRVPVLAGTLPQRLAYLDVLQPEFLPTLYNRDAGRMRIVLRARERQPAEVKLDLIENRVQPLARREFPEAKTTGLFVLLSYLLESLLADQKTSFLLAAAGIVTMMTLAFRSLRIGLISLVPNLFPIVVVIGGMGWLGVRINIATAMIASVSLGLTVDASIHYISGYRRARGRGLAAAEALDATHRGVGRALVFATLALIVGFSVLTQSHFIPLVYFGILVSVAMLGGLVGNLVLLPLLLRWVSRYE